MYAVTRSEERDRHERVDTGRKREPEGQAEEWSA